jgi:hypothetical protein
LEEVLPLDDLLREALAHLRPEFVHGPLDQFPLLRLQIEDHPGQEAGKTAAIGPGELALLLERVLDLGLQRLEGPLLGEVDPLGFSLLLGHPGHLRHIGPGEDPVLEGGGGDR